MTSQSNGMPHALPVSTQAAERVKVLYIGGYSRSGSTFFQRMLATQPGAVAIGEVCNFWQRTVLLNELCGCGARFSSCEFWRAVIEDVFGDLASVPADWLHRLRYAVQGNPNFPRLVVPWLRNRRYTEKLHRYSHVLERIYLAIQKVSGASLIIDASKVAPYAFLLSEMSLIDLHVVHLVRDSRATAFSWQRRKQSPEMYVQETGNYVRETGYMERYGLIKSSIEWVVFNLALEMIRLRGIKYVRIRYEDMLRAPAETLHAVSGMLGLSLDSIVATVQHGKIQLGTHHTAAGNTNRFEQGTIAVQVDTEWESSMAPASKYLVTTLTAPLLLRYGYLNPA
jgi:hypothetical protein